MEYNKKGGKYLTSFMLLGDKTELKLKISGAMISMIYGKEKVK